MRVVLSKTSWFQTECRNTLEVLTWYGLSWKDFTGVQILWVFRNKPASYGWFFHIWGKRLILKAFDLNADLSDLATLQTKKPPDWEAFLFLSSEKNIFQNFKAPSTTPYMLNHRFWLFFRCIVVAFWWHSHWIQRFPLHFGCIIVVLLWLFRCIVVACKILIKGNRFP